MNAPQGDPASGCSGLWPNAAGWAALAVYRWLLEDDGADPARVVVAGDSAGGGLTLALAVSARDAGLPLPAALVCISPWTDLAGTGESMRTKAGKDPCFTPEGLHLQAREYLGDADPRHSLASPLYADLRGLPPVMVQVGEDELLLDDARRLGRFLRRHVQAHAVPPL